MSAIVLQAKRVKNGPTVTSTAIGPFDTFEAADKHATTLCRQTDEFVYSVLSLVAPVQLGETTDG